MQYNLYDELLLQLRCNDLDYTIKASTCTTSKYYSYMFYAERNVRPCMILGYTLTTFPKSLIQTKTTKRTLHQIASRKRRRTLHQVLFCSQLFPFRKQNHKSYYPIIDDNFQLITFLLAHVSMKFKCQYICNIFQSNVIMFQKPTIHLIPVKLIRICKTRSSQLPCFSFVYFQPPRKLRPL